MPRRHTLGTLVTWCKQRVDLENDANIGTAEWKAMISNVYAVLFATVADTGLRYFEQTFDIETDGSESYYEPDAHLFTVGLDRVYSDGRRRALEELMSQERNSYAGLTGDAVAFMHVDDQFYLYPTPPAGQTYELLYVHQPPDMSSSADATVVDVVTPDGEEFLTWGVAVKALAKQGRDARLAMAERDAARQKVFEWAAEKSLNAPRRLVVGPTETDFAGFFDPADWRNR